MGLLWHFVSIDAAQTASRRELLDRYGQIAQFSALFPLLAFPIYFALNNIVKKFKSYIVPPQKEHQSPQVSRFPRKFKSPSSNWLSRVQWALDEQVIEKWGTRRQWLVAGLWTLWLLVLATKDTGDGMSKVYDLVFGCAPFSSS